MVQPQCGWQGPAEVAPDTEDGDTVWAGLQGNYRVFKEEEEEEEEEEVCLARRATVRSYSVSSSPSQDNPTSRLPFLSSHLAAVPPSPRAPRTAFSDYLSNLAIS
ncbi:hypothetical protein EYF80_062688 [Liparis tanakae]|uniref:Uncharacterized protein n=1 Tax=Liparis tanakae TaxID=230148 RepID=A0A4Z2EE89_9TELE|nr:hypothetical protein EYF80_062688 [Liparis tanakae]